jgi:hypothetical protein
VEPAEVAERVVEVLGRPRLVSSVPHWRGAQVRAMAGVPDLALRAAPRFTRTGMRHLAQVRAQASARSGRAGTSGGGPTSSAESNEPSA